MRNPLKKKLVPIEELQDIRGIKLPVGLEFRQLVVTGPPGAGKSYYINQIGGWPNEGYIDLTRKGWWKDQSLIYRPREISLGLPFVNHREALTVFEKEAVEPKYPLQLDFKRIKIPPAGNYWFSTNWMDRYIFEFLIPDPEVIYEQRLARKSEGYFPIDANLSLTMVERQVTTFREVALHLHRAGVSIYIREGMNDLPMRIMEPGEVSVPLWSLPQQPRKPSLRSLAGWKWLLFRKDPNEWLTITQQAQTITKICRLPHDGKSFEVSLGRQKLRFHPEIPLGATKKYLKHNRNWRITSIESCDATEIGGFARLKMGESVLIGKSNREYNNLFQFDKSVAKRHLAITNTKGDLILTPLDNEKPVTIYRIDNLDHREKVEENRYASLLTIRDLFGNPAKMIEPDTALALINQVNDILSEEAFRPLDKFGLPGSLLELPDDPTPIIIGDLHGQIDNLLKILTERCLLKHLQDNNAYLLFLGDGIHSEIAGKMDDMEDSILIMDLIFNLKVHFPKNVFYLRGNHDSFSPDISKNGISQGILMHEALMEKRGKKYVQAMQQLYSLLPYVAISKSFIACHAAPPLTETSLEDIINTKYHPELIRHMTTKRFNHQHQYRGYGKHDVKRFRKCLGMPKSTPFIVGHTPLDPFGSVWRNVGNIKNHHILYSAHQDGPAVFIRINEMMQPVSYPYEPLKRIIEKL